ncbi:MAG: exodeoxyribonuclease V subunit gamma [Polyangiaceae bacterium]|nr:exodeoxyribonuclease V subunit gamma [Polyangiaceae bacterium]
MSQLALPFADGTERPPSRALHIHRSNRPESLVDDLSEVLGRPLLDPMAADLIVVQGAGMATYLSVQLAKRRGLLMNVELSYPRRFIESCIDRVLGPTQGGGVSESTLFWALYAQLGQLPEDAHFEPLRNYLRGDSGGVRCLQLAKRIAQVFDEYLSFRPELILAWEAGHSSTPPEHAWQPALWRAVIKKIGGDHIAARTPALLRQLRDEATETLLPERVALFGFSSLPPLFFRIVAGLSERVEVHLFLVSPSAHYWSRPHSGRDELRAWDADAPGDLHFEKGNPLLASCGRLGAEFHESQLTQMESLGTRHQEHDSYKAPAGKSLLERVQRDIFELSTPPDQSPAPWDANDNSLRIHSCHSAMREVEVIHNELLELLCGHDARYQPQDVVVMTPNIEEYAPFIQAVFARTAGDEQFIPYRISDRSLHRECELIDALFRVLNLPGGRQSASEILDILTIPSVADHFGIEPDEATRATEWILQLGIRWGHTGADRARHGQPASDENTWQFGLDRLLLGAAMKQSSTIDAGPRLFFGSLPFDELEGSSAELAGKLAHFCDRLFGIERKLRQPKSLARWQETLHQILAGLFAQTAETAWQHQHVREALTRMTTEAATAGFEQDIDVSTLHALLEAELGQLSPERGFLAGGVTFCAMVPMRSIPFPVVCMLGMNDGAFPRPTQELDFDLIRHGPEGRRPGDRSRREDDRYLFLEALLAARSQLIISYTGQSIRDNSPRSPSVCISELVDYVCGHYQVAPSSPNSAFRPLSNQLVVTHPLQSFDKTYFDGEDPRLFSYQRSAVLGAAALEQSVSEESPWFKAPLPSAPSSPVLLLDDLVQFLVGPVRYLLNRRLGVYLRDADIKIEDREPIELSALERYSLGEQMLSNFMSGIPTGDMLALARASGALPPGQLGAYEFNEHLETVRAISEVADEWRQGGTLDALSLDLSLNTGQRLSGTLSPLYPRGLLDFRFADLAAKHQLRSWVRHLCLCASQAPGCDLESVSVGRAGRKLVRHQFGPVDTPLELLSDLAALFELGSRAPLLFEPSLSLTYAQRAHKALAPSEALQKLQPPNFPDEHWQRVVGDQPPPFTDVATEGPDFCTLALRVFEPMLKARRE